MTSRPLTAALVLTASIALAGCSAPAPDETTAPAPVESPAPSTSNDLGLPAQTLGSDPDCSLYSLDDLSAVWGVPLVDTDTSTVIEAGGLGGIIYGCDYNETDDGTGLTVSLSYREYDTPEGAIQYLADIRSGADADGDGGQAVEDVPGLGDEAFYSFKTELVGTPKNLSESLYVRTGNLALQINSTNLGGVKPEYRQLLIDTYTLRF